MPATRKSIPLHKLRESTDQGFHIERVYARYAAKEAMLMGVHRDDHYIFLLQETGRSKMMVDFQYFTLKKAGLFFVLPGQVHHYLDSDHATTGWFIAMDAELVPDMFRGVLEDPLLSVKPLSIPATGLDPIIKCLQLIHMITRQEPALHYSKQMIYGQLTSFVAMVAAAYARQPQRPAKGHAEKLPRSLAIAQQFRKSLTLHYKTLKSPAEYAIALNLSPSYLNEAVKAATGFSVSYWIQQEIVLEAKRLLYHSDCSVKEIAYELGYEDHAYFSRLFKKTVQLTPGAFRRHYRE
ncbi:MAG TPA: helix-turn-helix transcriptional regulator [Puia sp.]|nr:helix-turn-helix transcriptional regulator [Puia sp.]